MLKPQTPLPSITPKQEQILQGAMRVFLRSSYAATSMDRVAAEAGVSKQTIYSHFGDKEGLFKALIERVTIGRFYNVIDSASHRDNPEGLLRELANTYLTKVAGDSEYLSLLRIVIAESERFPELAKLFCKTVVVRGRSLLTQYFTTHSELGIKDPAAVAHIFFGSLVSYVMVQDVLYGRDIMPIERDRLVDSLIDLVLNQRH